MGKKPNFAKLQAQWYKKLADSGFDDIEYQNDTIRSGVPSALRTYTGRLSYASSLEYGDMVTRFLNDYTFENEFEKAVWDYYSNGLSIRAIAVALASAGISDKKRSSVFNLVKRLEKTMLEKYLAK